MDIVCERISYTRIENSEAFQVFLKLSSLPEINHISQSDEDYNCINVSPIDIDLEDDVYSDVLSGDEIKVLNFIMNNIDDCIPLVVYPDFVGYE